MVACMVDHPWMLVHDTITDVLYSEKIWWTLNFMILAKILFLFFFFLMW